MPLLAYQRAALNARLCLRLAVYFVVLSACHSEQLGELGHAESKFRPGFYVHPGHSHFVKEAIKVDTDKVTTHNYDAIYAKYFEMAGRRHIVKRFLEIGLGCNMAYGPGHSAVLWRQFFPLATIWFGEYDKLCVDKHLDKLKTLNIDVVTGDQADIPTLKSWIETTGGNFDVIIDDGGHSAEQQYNSFVMLFTHALRPGGLYVIEDFEFRDAAKYGNDFFIDAAKDWFEQVVLSHPNGNREQLRPLRFPLPPRIKFIDCIAEACAFIKCYDDDPKCVNHRFDPRLLPWKDAFRRKPE